MTLGSTAWRDRLTLSNLSVPRALIVSGALSILSYAKQEHFPTVRCLNLLVIVLHVRQEVIAKALG